MPRTWFRKPSPPQTRIEPDSRILLRVGTVCDQTCIMCPNPTGDSRRFLATTEVIRRIEFVASVGFRRVVLTGGEPSRHPGFEEVMEALATRGITWDLVTNGGVFSNQGWGRKAKAAGLNRAVVSLHSNDPDVNSTITGTPAATHRDRVRAIHRLLDAGVETLLNHVLLPHNRARVLDFIRFCAREFGRSVRIKIAFPLFDLAGREWGAVRQTYADCADVIRAARLLAADLGIGLLYEGIPNCIHGDPGAINTGRLGHGETHYLEDQHGNRVFSIGVIESHLFVFAEFCTRCVAFDRCAGVYFRYAERFGMPEMLPFEPPARPWWL